MEEEREPQMSTLIANRFRQAFPGATFEVRQLHDHKYDIDVTDGPLDAVDVANFEVNCHLADIDVIIND